MYVSSKTILNDRKPYRLKNAVREDTNSCCSLSFFGGSLLRAFFGPKRILSENTLGTNILLSRKQKKTLNEIKKENMVAKHTFALPMWTATINVVCLCEKELNNFEHANSTGV